MANIDRELREEREAKDLEYRWRQGSIEMLLLGRDSPANAVKHFPERSSAEQSRGLSFICWGGLD